MKNIIPFMLAVIINSNISAQTQHITVTIAGNGFDGYSGDGGAAKRAKVEGPIMVTRDRRGNLYFTNNNLIRKVAAKDGIITTVGGGGISSSVGVPATSVAISPRSIISDPAGNLYFQTNNSIKRIDAATNIITNFAGTGALGYGGDGGPATAALFDGIAGICMDNSGNIYITELSGGRIRKVANTGIVSTIAGNGIIGYSGDGGPATNARLSAPNHICINPSGDIYFTDQHEDRIRKINASTGIITTFAGSASGRTLFDCLASSCYLGPVSGMCHDGGNNIYFNEMSCSLRRIDERTDSVYAVAGDFTIESFRNDTVSLFAWMKLNIGICGDSAKNMYVADHGNNRIRKIIQLSHVPSFAFGEGQHITPCPGFRCPVDPLLWVTDLDSAQTEIWTVITEPIHGTLSGFPATTLSNGVHETVKPSGVFYTASSSYLGADSFRVQISDGSFADTITIYVSVQGLSAEAITGISAFCPGQSATLSATTSGGVWSASNPAVSIGSTSGGLTAIYAGIDTITYVISPYCPDIITKVITVNPMPVAGPITGADTVCLGGTTTLIGATPGGIWTCLGTVATIGSATGIVSGITTGTAHINYKVSNAWCTAVASKMEIVFSPFSGSVSGPDTVCIGASIPLSSTIPGGVWSTTSGLATVTAGGIVSGISPGIDTIAYSIIGGPGCVSKTNFTLNVTDGIYIDPGTIIGEDSVCPGETIMLFDTASGGIWSVSNTKASISSSGVLTGALSGKDTVFYSIPNGCRLVSASKIINIKSFPHAGIISGDDTLCKFASMALVNTVSYGVWSSSNANAYITVDGIVSGKHIGLDTIKYLVINECGTDMATKEINVVKCVPDDLSQPIAATALTVAPNPSSGTFTVQLSSPLQESAEVIITNMLGQTIHTFTTATNKATNVALHAPPGLYLLTITTPTGRWQQKVLVE